MEANGPKAAVRIAGRLVVLLVGLVWAAADIGPSGTTSCTIPWDTVGGSQCWSPWGS